MGFLSEWIERERELWTGRVGAARGSVLKAEMLSGRDGWMRGEGGEGREEMCACMCVCVYVCMYGCSIQQM